MNHVLTFVIQYVFVGGIERYEKFDVEFEAKKDNNFSLKELSESLAFAFNELLQQLVADDNDDSDMAIVFAVNADCSRSILNQGFIEILETIGFESIASKNELNILSLSYPDSGVNPFDALINYNNILYINIVRE
jgi:hypothetical protein